MSLAGGWETPGRGQQPAWTRWRNAALGLSLLLRKARYLALPPLPPRPVYSRGTISFPQLPAAHVFSPGLICFQVSQGLLHSGLRTGRGPGLAAFPRRLMPCKALLLHPSPHMGPSLCSNSLGRGYSEDRLFPGTLSCPVWGLHPGGFWPFGA